MTIESPGEFWKDYELVDSGNFEKLERFGKYYLSRPEPKALWDKTLSDDEWKRLTHTRFKPGAGFARAGKEDSGTWERLKKIVERVREGRNIHIHLDLIAGLPCYSLKMLENDMARLIRMNVGEIQLELLKLLPGTAFRNEHAGYGLKFSPLPPYEVLGSDCMGFQDLVTAKAYSKILDYWYNDPCWKDFFRNAVLQHHELKPRCVHAYEGQCCVRVYRVYLRPGVLGA